MKHAEARKPLFERLKAGLEEGVRYARGELNLRSTTVPDRPPALRAQEVVGLRERLNMSQDAFAGLLNVSLKTVQSWEQGDRKPSRAALRLLQILQVEPGAVCQAVGIRPRRERAKAPRS